MNLTFAAALEIDLHVAANDVAEIVQYYLCNSAYKLYGACKLLNVNTSKLCLFSTGRHV